MSGHEISRRRFALVAGSGLLLERSRGAEGTLTARQVVERIQKNVGVPWRAETVDTFKAGNPDAPVHGIVTTFMSTLRLLERAASSGKNFVVTHEPTFYNHFDSTQDLVDDPVYRYKQEFIKKHNLILWRFHDHWHARKPDAIFAGFTRTLGWEKYETPGAQASYVLPPRPLAEVAKEIEIKLKTQSMRVVGDPSMVVSRIGRGSHDLAGNMRALADHDAVIAGEVREWDSAEYVRDAMLVGDKKALIILAHERWEEFGMEECADWLRTFVPEVPVEYMPSGEPFWNPLQR